MNAIPVLITDKYFIFPNCENYLQLDTDLQYKKAILRSLQHHQGQLLIFFGFKPPEVGSIGVLAKILLEVSSTKDITLAEIVKHLKKVKLWGISRIKLTKGQQQNDSFLDGEYEVVLDEFDKKKELQELTEKLVRSITDILEKNHLSSSDLSIIGDADSLQIIDFIAQNSKEIDWATKQKILSELNPNKRLDILINLPTRKKIEGELNEFTKKIIRKDQETYYLLKKKEAIEKRLKESRGYASEEIKKFLEKLEKDYFPLHIKELVIKKIEQLEMTSSSAGESNILRNYIDWILKMPWARESSENYDLKKAKEILDKKHFGLKEVKEKILTFLAAQQAAGTALGQVLCFLGPPGVGKTSLAKSIAEATGRKFISISLGGSSDEADIRGHRITYVGAYPGKLVKAMCSAQTKNPLILIDEIDKIARFSNHGDPAYALLEALEPSTNNEFVDNYLSEDAPCDLSKVLFICTANTWDRIPIALLDRLELIRIPGYTIGEKTEIAKKHLIPSLMSRYKLNEDIVAFSDESIREIIDYYTREAGVRTLKNRIDTILRKFLFDLSEDKSLKLVVTEKTVSNYLKNRIYEHTSLKESRPGIFNGLAFTEYGGEILPIEVACYERGKKDYEIVTGNLGKVMKESCHVALTYIRANAEKFGIKDDFFSTKCIHIHAIEAAVPKDGPSAGVALTTAIISAVTNIAVSRYFGATGEMTLHGWIEPIGGLKEKSIAAQRSKLKTVFIPKDNIKDLDDVPAEVKSKLKFIPVSSYDEVWQILFLENFKVNKKEVVVKTKKEKN